MGAYYLIGVQHQLERFNAAAGQWTRGADASDFILPTILLYLAFNFIPTAVGLGRGLLEPRRIVWRNAATPLAIAGLSFLPFEPGKMRAFQDLLVSLVIVGGVFLWISTMIDASTGPTRAIEED